MTSAREERDHAVMRHIANSIIIMRRVGEFCRRSERSDKLGDNRRRLRVSQRKTNPKTWRRQDGRAYSRDRCSSSGRWPMVAPVMLSGTALGHI
eukprot:1453308-Prymnesium_polylepis.2